MSTKILLIEDDQILAELLEKKLEASGYNAIVVMDGQKGLEAIKAEKPDLVLLDILLPTLNGYEILEAKRLDPEIKDIPVVIISNSGQPVELQRALELGAQDYFIKAQIDPDEILSKVKAIAPVIKTDPNASIVNKKILLVEDDTFLSDVLTKKLFNEKCDVTHANSGEIALNLIEKQTPDVVLLDLVLPGMSGFDTLQKIKENPKSKDVKVIILSNLSQPDNMDRAKELGATMFIVKATSTPADIFSTLKSLLASEDTSKIVPK